MRTSLQDLIATCPNQLEANSIIVYDGCNWIVQTIPDGITCNDVQECIDCEHIFNTVLFSNGFIVDARECSVKIDPDYISANIGSSFVCNTGILTVGTTSLDLSCIANMFSFSFQDGLTNTVVNNHEQITVQWLDGLRFNVGNNLLTVGLPLWGTTGQVLTWSEDSDAAYRANPLAICCDQIQSCMAPIIAGLQNQLDTSISSLQSQINIIAGQLCPCSSGDGTPLTVLEEFHIVNPTTQFINFIGGGITATQGALANYVDVTLNIITTFDCQTDVLTIAWSTVDLSCLRYVAPTCYPAPLSLDGNTLYSNEGETCESSVDLSGLIIPANILTSNVIYVAKNWNNATAEVNNLGKPCSSISYAIYLATQNSLPISTIVVFPWHYTENLSVNLKSTNIHLMDGVIIHWHISVYWLGLNVSITWEWILHPITNWSIDQVIGRVWFILWSGLKSSKIDITLKKIIFDYVVDAPNIYTIFACWNTVTSELNEIKITTKSIDIGDATTSDALNNVKLLYIQEGFSQSTFDISFWKITLLQKTINMFSNYTIADSHNNVYFHDTIMNEFDPLTTTVAHKKMYNVIQGTYNNVFFEKIYTKVDFCSMPLEWENSLYHMTQDRNTLTVKDCISVYIPPYTADAASVFTVWSGSMHNLINMYWTNIFYLNNEYEHTFVWSGIQPNYNILWFVTTSKASDPANIRLPDHITVDSGLDVEIPKPL